MESTEKAAGTSDGSSSRTSPVLRPGQSKPRHAGFSHLSSQNAKQQVLALPLAAMADWHASHELLDITSATWTISDSDSANEVGLGTQKGLKYHNGPCFSEEAPETEGGPSPRPAERQGAKSDVAASEFPTAPQQA